MSAELKELHDRLLAEMPETETHETCSLCNYKPEGDTQMTTTPEEQLQAIADAVEAAVAEATAPLNEKIATYEAAAQETEAGKAVAEAVAPLEEKIGELQGQLDEAANAKGAAETELANVLAYLETEKEEADRQAEIASRRDDRIAKLQEHTNFDEAYLMEHADRFAAMSDEDFEARLAEFAAAGVKKSEAPVTTAMAAGARETASSFREGSMLGELRTMHADRSQDPRYL